MPSQATGLCLSKHAGSCAWRANSTAGALWLRANFPAIGVPNSSAAEPDPYWFDSPLPFSGSSLRLPEVYRILHPPGEPGVK